MQAVCESQPTSARDTADARNANGAQCVVAGRVKSLHPAFRITSLGFTVYETNAYPIFRVNNKIKRSKMLLKYSQLANSESREGKCQDDKRTAKGKTRRCSFLSQLFLKHSAEANASKSGLGWGFLFVFLF